MSTFLKACRGEPTDYTPLWFMRQAGRYQKSYRTLREKVSFIELCKNSDLATEVTLSPIQQFGFDAAIVFSDILVLLEPLNIGFEFQKNDGPVILAPVRTAAQIEMIPERINAKETLRYVMTTLHQVQAALPKTVPLIGFSGAPFTLASYAIEGGASKNYLHTKRLMYSDEGAWNLLMQKLSHAVVDYLNAQIDAGADAVQLFDSWVGCLSPADYARYVEPHTRFVFEHVSSRVPRIHFATGNPTLYPLMQRAGGDVLGVDWRVSLKDMWGTLGCASMMGNLDPVTLLGPLEYAKQSCEQILQSVRGRTGHVFNLGHGILPETPEDHVRAIVDFVHEASQAQR